MKYILLKVLEKNIYHEYYFSTDLDFLKNMRDILNKKDDGYFFIVEVLK